MSEQLASMHIERREEQLLIRLSGEVDLSNADSLHTRIERAIEGCPHVIIDLSAVEYLDSQGLRLLIRLAQKLAAADAKLELVAPPNSVARDVLELTHITDEISARDDHPTPAA
jgi:stage II sporulation protein AA (anti-sigma F factor antagonist)